MMQQGFKNEDREYQIPTVDVGITRNLGFGVGGKAISGSGGMNLKQALEEYYRQVDPSKNDESNILKVLRKYEGREAEMIVNLEAKYKKTFPNYDRNVASGSVNMLSNISAESNVVGSIGGGTKHVMSYLPATGALHESPSLQNVLIDNHSTEQPITRIRRSSTTDSYEKVLERRRKIHGETSELAIDMFALKESSHLDEHDQTRLKDTNKIARLSIIMLISLGVVAGLINHFVIFLNEEISLLQATIIASDKGTRYGIGFFLFLLTTSIFVFMASFLCKLSPRAAGSGLPELKSLLSSELKYSDSEKLVSKRTLFAKIFGLILALGSCLSVGSEGPLVHTAACIAYFLVKHIYEFQPLLDSPSMLRQIYAASTAVGVSSTFNSPVGGLLFSIEVTSTFYLVSNYWKSFIAALSGSIACNLILLHERDSLVVLPMEVLAHPFDKWELFVFATMSVCIGYIAHYYLVMHQWMNVLMRPYTRGHPLITCVCVGIFTALVIYSIGDYTETSVGVLSLVKDVLGKSEISYMSRFNMIPEIGLLITLICRGLLTLLGTNLPVPAGIFMPVFLIGGYIGRLVGCLVVRVIGSAHIELSSFALVGAVAMSAGVTHTISAAVIAVELTNNLPMLMPCLLASVIASGITRLLGYSVYDRGMLNKGLDSLQLLLMGPVSLQQAKQVMETKFSAIPLRTSLLEILHLIAESDQDEFPVVSNTDGKNKLEGSVKREELFLCIKSCFSEFGSTDLLRRLLPYDFAENFRKVVRERVFQEKKDRREKFWNSVYKAVGLKITPKIVNPENQSEVFHSPTRNPIHSHELEINFRNDLQSPISPMTISSDFPSTSSIGDRFQHMSQNFSNQFVSKYITNFKYNLRNSRNKLFYYF
jgi:H+/Cl- antiporter ClcA